MKPLLLLGVFGLLAVGCAGNGPVSKDMVKAELESHLGTAPVTIVSLKSRMKSKANYFVDVSFEAALKVDSPVLFDGRFFRKYSEEGAAVVPTHLDVMNKKVESGTTTWSGSFSFIKEGEEWRTANWRPGLLK